MNNKPPKSPAHAGAAQAAGTAFARKQSYSRKHDKAKSIEKKPYLERPLIPTMPTKYQPVKLHHPQPEAVMYRAGS